MNIDIDDLETFLKAGRNLKTTRAAFEKKSERARDVDLSMSRRAIGKATADMHHDGMNITRCWDDLHAAAVNLGLCEAKESDFYREKTLNWSGFHKNSYWPKKPRCVLASEKPPAGTAGGDGGGV